MRIASIGDRIARGSYRIHSQFDGVINYVGPAGLVVLAERSFPFGPLNIISFDSVRPANTLVVEAEAFTLDDHRVPLNSCARYDSSLPRGRLDRARVEALGQYVHARGHPESLSFLLAPAPSDDGQSGFQRELRRVARTAVEDIWAHPREAARQLHGLGRGLTPSGDDLLAGLMIGARFAGSAARHIHHWAHVADESPPLVRSFLELACEGRVNDAIKRLIQALLHPEPSGWRARADVVLAHGATSGADFLTGFVLGARGPQGLQKEDSQ